MTSIEGFALHKLAPYLGLVPNDYGDFSIDNVKEFAYLQNSVFLPAAYAAVSTVPSLTDENLSDSGYWDTHAQDGQNSEANENYDAGYEGDYGSSGSGSSAA